jgi:hypothetical protein
VDVDAQRGVVVGLVLAEFVFVACFVLAEAVTLVLLRWTTKLDRRAQALPDRQYATWFGVPMITAGSGVGVAVGVNLITGDSELGYYEGLFLIFGSLLVFGYALLGLATGTLPRTHFRARVRRRLAETGELFASSTTVSRADAARLGGWLRRIERLGGRLSDLAGQTGWRASVRGEPTWLVWVVALAFVLPIVGAVLIATRGRAALDADGLRALGLLLVLSMATAAGVVMRRIRKRMELRDLGEELRTGSAALLERLAELTEPEPAVRRPSLPARLWSWIRRPRA